MKVIIYKNGMATDISGLLTSYSYQESIEQSVGQFTFDMVVSPFDEKFNEGIPSLECGDLVALKTDDNYYNLGNYILFYGRIYEIGEQSTKGTITYTCYDLLKNLANSQTYKTYNGTAESIAKSIFNNFGYSALYVEPTGINLGTLVYQDESYLDIIRDAYKRAGKVNGKKYYIYMEQNYVATYEQGKTTAKLTLDDTRNILSSNQTENIEEICNKVNVYDSEDKLVNTLTNQESIAKYGLFEQNYTLTSDNDITGAKALLKNATKTITMTVLGEINLFAGRSVEVNDSITGLRGLFLITNVTHNWSGATYTSELNLEFMKVIK